MEIGNQKLSLLILILNIHWAPIILPLMVIPLNLELSGSLYGSRYESLTQKGVSRDLRVNGRFFLLAVTVMRNPDGRDAPPITLHHPRVNQPRTQL